MRWGFALVGLVAITSCYSPDLDTCNISCSNGRSCPDGMTCVPGANVCRSTNGDNSACSTPDGPPGVTGRLFKQITAGGRHTCAIDVAGLLVCWGANEHGQLRGVAGQPEQVGINVTEPAVSGWVDISGGGTHTCGIGLDERQNRQLFCWGDNGSLQLAANGASLVNAANLIELPGGAVAAEVSAGADHTCAVSATGELFCWGANDQDQLGNGIAGGTRTPTPVPQQGGNWVHVDAGTKTTCATTDNGALFCWGRNSVGQLGNGMPGGSTEIPQAVSFGAGPSIKVVSVGFQHVCAIDAVDTVGAVRCWGTDLVGQVGLDVSQGSDYSTPQTPAGIGATTMWSEVRTGDAMSCAIREGEVFCWGLQGDGGALGDHCIASNNFCRQDPGPLSASPVVGLVPLEATAFTLAVGESHGCALFGDLQTGGVAKCWGSNSDGQLANSGISQVPIAMPIAGDAPWNNVRAGRDFACAIKADETVWCWGANHRRQAADSDAFFEPSPVQRMGVAGAIDLAVGEDHACALIATTGTQPVICWGSDIDNELGELKDTDGSEQPTLPSAGPWVAITAAGNVTCVESSNPLETVCWGGAAWEIPAAGALAIPRTVTMEGPFGAKVRLGTNTACFGKGGMNTTMQCYGTDAFNQRGNGGAIAADTDPPTNVLLGGTVDIADHSGGATNGHHHCAIELGTAHVFCFGDNQRNQINDTGTQVFSVGELVVSGAPIKADLTDLSIDRRHVVAGGDFSCAVLEGGVVSCWGDNTGMQCTRTGADAFTGSAGIPTAIASSGPGTYLTITAGDFFACGLQTDNQIYCWGFSPKGQTGTGPGGADQNYVEDVRTLAPGN